MLLKTQVIKLNSFCEIYINEDAFKTHNFEHFQDMGENTKDFYSAETEVSFCKPVYPTDNVKWGSARDDFLTIILLKLFFDGL